MISPLRVTAAYVATQGGLGQQMADAALIAALAEREDLEVDPYPVGPLRATQPVRRRLPLSRLDAAPFAVKRAVGALSYPRTLVHRFDCRLPPAPNEVVTVHDLAPLRFPDEGAWPRHVGEGLRQARAVVCPSQFSANEVSAEFGLNNVRVVPNGIDPAFFDAKPLPKDARERLGIRERYVLHTGGATKRKNLDALAAAWQRFHGSEPDVDLVLTGPTDTRRTALFGSLPGVRLLGRVSRAAQVGLMAGSVAVVVPSTYEGYGLPAAEALACGVPVVAAACTSIPEVVGQNGILAVPRDAELADALLKAIQGIAPARRTAAIAWARAQTWQAAAEAYVDLYRDVISRSVLPS